MQITDYWLIRGTKLHVPMLYQNEGIYRYWKGINWRAVVTLLVVIPINLPGLIAAINKSINIGEYANFYRASWLTSFFISAIVYYVLTRIFPPTSTFVDHTVESLDEETLDVHTKDADVRGWDNEKDSTPSEKSPVL